MIKNFLKNICNSTILFCLVNCLIVFAFYFHTIGYSWKHFDENIIFQETLLPIPKSFLEIFDLIKAFGFNHYFEASNPFYSDITNIRRTSVAPLLFIFWLFQKNASCYHLFSLTLHILNTAILFFILKKNGQAQGQAQGLPLQISLLTLLWSLHPANVESILFATNIFSLVTYFFCMLLIYYYIRNQKGQAQGLPLLPFFLYSIPLLLNEYAVTLPIILFLFIFKEPITAKLKLISPLFVVLLIFSIFYFTSDTTIKKIPDLLTTTERIFWLSPQIFFHFIKLVFFPLKLSIDQSAFVKIADTIFDPYAIFCVTFMFALILLSIISLLTIRKKISFYFFISFVPFFLALLPFLHIISPVYNLASERYLYLPLGFLIMGLSHFIFSITQKNLKWKTITVTMLFVILCISGTRAYLRTLDWKDSTTLLTSAINTSPNNLFKGLRQEMLATSISILQENTQQTDIKNLRQEALKTLTKALQEFKQKKDQHNLPEVIKFYGLDIETKAAKTAFLIALTDYNINNNPERAYEIFSPFVNKLRTVDTHILNFYYKILFLTNKINEAEELLNKSFRQKNITTTLLVALSDLTEYKYKDLKKTEKYLLQSFKYHPYSEVTLFGLKRLYRNLNNAEKFAFFSYLFGLRTHDILSLQEATDVYIALKNKGMSNKIMKKLLTQYPIDNRTLQLEAKYEHDFGMI